jgi:hypothetical protein
MVGTIMCSWMITMEYAWMTESEKEEKQLGRPECGRENIMWIVKKEDGNLWTLFV